MSRDDGQKFIDRYDERQSHSLQPGYFTGGHLDPIFLAKRPNKWGWYLVVGGLAATGLIVSNRADTAWWEMLWLVGVAGLMIVAGVKVLRWPTRRGGKP